MIRLDETGLLSLRMGTGGHMAEGWMLPVHNQVFCIAADVTSGALLFGIFNGVATARADVTDGLTLGSALDGGRTPTASAMIASATSAATASQMTRGSRRWRPAIRWPRRERFPTTCANT